MEEWWCEGHARGGEAVDRGAGRRRGGHASVSVRCAKGYAEHRSHQEGICICFVQWCAWRWMVSAAPGGVHAGSVRVRACTIRGPRWSLASHGEGSRGRVLTHRTRKS